MKILPLRNMVLVRFQERPALGTLWRPEEARTVRPAVVVACGPEVRDLHPDMVALVNSIAGTAIDGCLLVPESGIVGTLP